MSKYEPLQTFLKSQGRDYIPMRFADIERVLNGKLPPSKSRRAWWSNNFRNNVMTKEWLSARSETESADVVGEKLVFRRVRKARSRSGFSNGSPTSPRPRHRCFGFMKGMIKVQEGFDVTQPFSDEPWDQGYLGEDRLK
ncbi:hypothetical protein [Nitratireductor sp. StC3]|uniref:DUF7662 domain-containing protein n=1 Tax=Nitratireductor sp. StC3 TaxID=2126741 RepID=UPI000D0D787E|nr:hypothetical protein [Nitratireductor sp. StC3]PSM17486.1 hypothetical protein C7T96_14255 [Nitratireductor sp. StC3]